MIILYIWPQWLNFSPSQTVTLSRVIWRSGILPCHILPPSLASCSQECHLSLFALIHTPQPGKVFVYKTFIKLWRKIFPYGFSLSKTIERSFSLENLTTFLLKVHGLKQPQTSNYCGTLWNHGKSTRLKIRICDLESSLCHLAW